jgi:hypothetical protein
VYYCCYCHWRCCLVSWDVRFEFQPARWVRLVTFLVIFQSSSRQMPWYTLKQVTITSFRVLLHLLFTNHPVIQRIIRLTALYRIYCYATHPLILLWVTSDCLLATLERVKVVYEWGFGMVTEGCSKMAFDYRGGGGGAYIHSSRGEPHSSPPAPHASPPRPFVCIKLTWSSFEWKEHKPHRFIVRDVEEWMITGMNL